ncbi:transcriptional regulator [Paraburkholderia sp. JHI2823]|uniref:helix-turn-helix domain-containing protein n=1 Tax=Paraburkholderia TaxID=1822464 RepID=UPI0004292F0E|nr:transcriptional regulator [Paraburkholderia mimosarum]
MDIRPIHNERDYHEALQTVSSLVDADPAPGTPEGDRLEILATLVERYETEHFPLDLPDPVEAIKFRMEQAGLSASDMQPYLGNLNRVYEVLNRKRGLSLAMIRRLNRGLNIPAEVLIGEENCSQTARGEMKRTQ